MKKVMLIVIAALLAGCASNEPGAPGAPNEVEAQTVAKNVIKSRSIDPGGVDFEGEGEKYIPMPDSSFVFIGLVRMPNRLGLKTPMNYNVVIKWLGGDWQNPDSWKVEDCKITEP